MRTLGCIFNLHRSEIAGAMHTDLNVDIKHDVCTKIYLKIVYKVALCLAVEPYRQAHLVGPQQV